MHRPNQISFAVITVFLVLTGWLNLGMLALSTLFSYFIINQLDFFKGRPKWPALLVFVGLLVGLGYGLTYLFNAMVNTLPGIAEKAVPAIATWANDHRINLPFTDMESLKANIVTMVGNEVKNLGAFANFASGATKQFIYLIVGIVVAMCLFVDPRLELDRPLDARRFNLYSVCCEEIGVRVATFYESFAIVMGAQVIISLIDTTLTGIFVEVMGLSHLVVAVGVTFICGLLPVVGNLLSNTLIVALGFIASPTKGLIALGFLVTIHQLEYFLNSKIIGGRIRSPLWLTMLGLVIGEALMGVTGMILAPVVLHYLRIESTKIAVLDKEK